MKYLFGVGESGLPAERFSPASPAIIGVFVTVALLGTPLIRAVAAQTAPNVALGKTVTASVPSTQAALSIVTDGTTTTNPFVSLAVGRQWIEVDLQGDYDISSLRFFHYWGDGRTYRDVIAMVSPDGVHYSSVFNNDVDGSAGFGLGSNAEYAETYAGKNVTLPVSLCSRFVRLYSNGSNLNGYNHYVEVQAFGTPSNGCQSAPSVTNVALGKPVTASVASTQAALSIATDAATTTNPFISLAVGQQWIEVDLQGDYDISRLQFFHYWGDGRTYKDVIATLSPDGVNYTAVFNNDADGSGGLGVGSDAPYADTYTGKTVTLANAICARFVRLYSNGSNLNGYNHYVEIQAFGTASTTACGPVTPPPPPVPTGPSLTIAPNREFLADSFVHKPLADDAELDPRSATWVADIQGQISRYFGVAGVNIYQYTPAIFIVGDNVPTVRVRAWDRNNASWSFPPLQEKWLAVPLPIDFVAASGTDEEAVVYQPSTGKMWEFWHMRKTGATVVNSAGQTVDEWGARWGGRMDDVAGNPGYFLTEGGDWYTTSGVKYGTTATSLTFLGGIITIEEQQRGVIEHVIGVAIPETLAYPKWSWPANRTDGQMTNANAIPEGTIFRLPANLNLDAMDMDPYARMIAKAVQKHGMVVWDRSGAVGFRAENPANQYPDGDPYKKVGGILNCPGGTYQQACWPDSNGRLRGFPWNQLQALKTRMNQ